MIDFVFSGTLKAFKVYNGVQQKKEMASKLIELEAAQTRLFDMFTNEIKAIQEGPFYVGLTYLEQANDDHRSPRESKKMVKNALQEFIKAYGVQRAKFRKTAFDVHFTGFIQSYISITWLMIDSPKDAKNWIEKSIVSLQEGQRLFKDDISNLKAEILEIQLEEDQHNRKLNDSVVYAGLDFFFGNASLAEKKRKLPEYNALVDRYSKAQSESHKYMLEMEELHKGIDIELLKYEESKGEAASKVKGLFGTVTGIAGSANNKMTEETSVLEIPLSVEKTNRIQGVFNKFKK
ncbi:hypothetical protein [Exiguobacterium sp. H66]|uniref:hypothetical protein n=1 Tax=Exiguobacterium sp. H66 TaxID=2751208 RepID=UPI001BE81306|nr:hypothetical protein [Exiguobacterium sp. H66]